MTSSHMIRQQYLHIEVNGTESDGLALQRSLSAFFEHWLVPALDATFERCAPLDGHLYVERLEINAGVFTLERLERDLAESVAQAIEKSLREQMSRSHAAPIIQPRSVEHRTAQHFANEALVYFLKTGTLPWTFPLRQGGNLERVILESWEDGTKSGIDLRALDDDVLRVLSSATARQRLVRQFSLAFLEALLTRLSPEGKKLMDNILAILRRFPGPADGTKSFEHRLWEIVFADVVASRALTAASVVGEAWSAVAVTAGTANALARWLALHWPGAIQATRANSMNRTEQPALQRAGSQNLGPVFGEHPDAAEGIYVENAGLVLLHPFLPQFFAALGIATEDKMIQPERALCLLHFLTTGQPIAPEYELILAKILCNVPLPTPVECDLKLADLEKQEGNGLLGAVIRHWNALGDTSPDGLRGTFLLRTGKVSLRDDGDWLMQVESKTYDILLDQLPWGISMIKLPWMEKMLWVEWR